MDLHHLFDLPQPIRRLPEAFNHPSYTADPQEQSEMLADVVMRLQQALVSARRKPDAADRLRAVLQDVASIPRMRRFIAARLPANAWIINSTKTYDVESYRSLIKAIIAQAQFPEPPAVPESPDRLQNLLDWLRMLSGHPAPKITSMYDSHRTWGQITAASEQIEHGWLVHFTEHADGILARGFHGIADAQWLGLTKWIKPADKTAGGFNFAYTALSKQAIANANFINTENERNYGMEAFVFYTRFIEINHQADRERQAIFLGDEVQPSNCHVLRRTQDKAAKAFLWRNVHDNTVGTYQALVKQLIG